MENYRKHLKQPARSLRTSMTDAEQLIWYRVRRKQIHGVQFYRQKPLLSFIVDFYCPAAKLWWNVCDRNPVNRLLIRLAAPVVSFWQPMTF